MTFLTGIDWVKLEIMGGVFPEIGKHQLGTARESVGERGEL